MTVCVTGIRSVAVDVCGLDEAAAFYSDVWRSRSGRIGMASARYFRGTAAYHHILSLHRADKPAIRRLVFAAADRDAVAALHAKVKASGVVTEAPHDWDAPGGGYGFGFKDPEGRNLAVACGGAEQAAAQAADRPHKITHVNLNAGDYDATTRFMTEALGFRLIDETVRARFLHAACPDHFSLALVKHSNATLNHIAFDMIDLDFGDARRGAHARCRLSDRVGCGPARPGQQRVRLLRGPRGDPARIH